MKKLAIVLISLLLVATFAACGEKETDLTSINEYMEPNYTHYIKDKDNKNIGTLTFNDIGGDSAEIIDYVGRYEPHVVKVPDKVGEKGSERIVSGIGKEAFFYCTVATEIVLPKTVEYIGDFAFAGCSSLEKITIPASVTYIGEGAFSGCTSLKEIKFEGKELESIGNFAFNGCSALTTVNFPEGLESIGDFAFNGCKSLAAFKAPSTLKSIGELTFYGCKALNKKDAVDLSAAVNITVTVVENEDETTKEIISIGEFAFVSVNKENIKVPADTNSAAYKYVAVMKEFVEAEEETETEAAE